MSGKDRKTEMVPIQELQDLVLTYPLSLISLPYPLSFIPHPLSLHFGPYPLVLFLSRNLGERSCYLTELTGLC